MSTFKSSLSTLMLCIVTVTATAQPQNDICSSAIDLQSYLNEPTQPAGPFSNVGATGNDLDIAGVTGCWLDDLTGNADGSSPQIDATVWFRLDGYDGVLSLYVQPCDTTLSFLTEDTQLALYAGECDSLEIVACNEDINSTLNNYWSGLTTEIQSGTTYYIAIDGFNYSGFGSPELPLTTGEFCISFQEPVVAVEERKGERVRVFPNPSEGFISLQAESGIREIQIADVTGKKISSEIIMDNSYSREITMPMDAGVYLIYVRTDLGIYTHRVVRN